ncbi:substrate-binding domain-containing protein [Microbacterium sp.]|uniref:substrate-binding domain-containing protein n=1 Tax=Microbacterium sp. TaxID=51671 RepID=UPI00345BD80A
MTLRSTARRSCGTDRQGPRRWLQCWIAASGPTFDDVEETRYSAPTMTSVNPGRQFIAQTAVRLLLDRIGGRSQERSPELIKAPFRIVERVSTAVA